MRSLAKAPILMIDPNVKYKMDNLVRLSNKEIAWHGFIEKNDNVYYWYDIVVYPQYVTGATVTPDEDEYTNWLIEQMQRDDFENMRIHGHSHVNMSTIPSGVDMDFRRNILKDIKANDYYIFIITNKRDDINIEIYDYENMVVFNADDTQVIIGDVNNYNISQLWAEEKINLNIKERIIPKCSTFKNQSGSSTRRKSQEKSMSSDVELWDQLSQSYYPGLD